MLSDAVKKHVPLFDRVDMVEAIATFIHQVSMKLDTTLNSSYNIAKRQANVKAIQSRAYFNLL